MAQPLNILLFTPWHPNKSNPTLGNFILRQAEMLRADHQVFILALTANGPSHSPDLDYVEGPHHIHCYVKSEFPWAWFSHHKTIKKLLKELKGFKPDIIHGQIAHASGYTLWLLQRHFKVPVVCSEHWSGYLPERQAKLRLVNRIHLYFAKKAVRMFLPVTQQLGEAMQNKLGLITWKVWRNPVNTQLFYPQNTKQYDFIHLSTLDENKNPKGILRAFVRLLNEFPHATLSIGGDGPLLDLQKEIENHNLSHNTVFLHGALPYQQAAERIRNARCLVQFSHYENLPCTIGEALQAGLYIISSRVGGIAEVVSPPANGLLVEAANEDALYLAMKTFLQNQPKPYSQQLPFDPVTLRLEINQVYRNLLFKSH